MKIGNVPSYENMLRKYREQLKSEQQDSQNMEDPQNMELNINTFTITTSSNMEDPNLILKSHMDKKDYLNRNVFLTEELYLHDNRYTRWVSPRSSKNFQKR